MSDALTAALARRVALAEAIVARVESERIQMALRSSCED
jgi:hypothetical protein